jgi:O-antigen polymerase
MKKYILTIIATLLFSTVFIAFQDIPEGTIESKNYGFFFVGIVSILVFTVFLLFSQTIKIEINKYDIFLFLFGGWVLFNTLIFKQLPSPIALSAFVCSTIVSLVLKQVIGNMPNVLNTLVTVIIVIGIAQVLFGILQLYGFMHSFHTGFKMTGSFHNPGPFGIYVGVIFVFCLGYYLFSTSETIRNIAAGFCLLSMLVLPVTQSRTAWIGVIVGMGYLAVMKYGLEYFKKYYTNKLIAISSIALTIALGVGLWTLKVNSALGRILIWRVSAEMVKTQPITGIGFGEYGGNYGFYQADFFKNNPIEAQPFIQLADISGYAFNDFLQILIENGLIGFCLFMAVLGYVLFSKIETQSEHIYPSKAGIIAILFAATCSYPFENISIWWLLLFFMAVVAVHLKNQFSFEILKMIRIPVLVGVCVISLFLIKNLGFEYQIKQDWAKALDVFNFRKYKQSEILLSKLIPKLPNNKILSMEYGRVLLQNKKPEQSLDVLLKIAPHVAYNGLYINIGNCYTAQKKYALAEKYFVQSINMIPNRMFPRYFLVKMYLQKGDTLKAKEMAQNIVRMPVKVTTSISSEIIAEMKKILKDSAIISNKYEK